MAGNTVYTVSNSDSTRNLKKENIMADFGVLSAVHRLLNQENSIKIDNERKTEVHISKPLPKSTLPYIVLELEEIWTSLAVGQTMPWAKLKLLASVQSEQDTGKESMNIAEGLRQRIDGQTLPLEDGKTVTFRLQNSVVDLPTHLNKTRSVRQFFEAIIRG